MADNARPCLLLAIALPEEAFEWQPQDYDVVRVFTGVGKTGAAMTLTEAVLRHRPVAVVNAGTAGALHYNVGDILVCDRFIDRDLKPLAIHGVVSERSSAVPVRPAFVSRIDGNDTARTFTVSTGDSFVVDAAHAVGDAVDMEAFALATVCQRYGLPFVAVKYVTDVIGQNSVAHWEEKLHDAVCGLAAYFAAYR